MNQPSFTTTFLVDESAACAFAAVTDVRGWWSQQIDGRTDELGADFHYDNGDLHRCTMRLVELLPDRKVVWECLDNHFGFPADEQEWVGTRLRFDISPEDARTRVTFTHEGLVASHECYDVCANAWGGYVGESLRSLIVTGTGAPNNAIRDAEALSQQAAQPGIATDADFRTTFSVRQSPHDVFDAICDVRGWWSGEIDGLTDAVGEEFSYTVPGVHFSRQRVTELDPGRRVAWLVVDSRLDYLRDTSEWNGSTITFDLVPDDAGTEVTFTHQGLVPEIECYDECSSAWSSWVLPDLQRRISVEAARV